MVSITKKQQEVEKKFDFTKKYGLKEAVELLKKSSYVQFDPALEIAVRLGIDPKKSEQVIRGTVQLPHGCGKVPRILVICTPDKEEEAKKAGATYAGLEQYLEKIAKGWCAIDVIVAMPALMAKLGPLGRILGPKGLMPNPKSGTVTLEVGSVVKAIKAGRIDLKSDGYGIVHASVGRLSFSVTQLEENAKALVEALHQLKPATAKGDYLKSGAFVTYYF